MKHMKWILLLTSGLLYTAAHVMSYYLWWLAFFAWAPLFYCAATERLSFKEGFIWGLVALGGNLVGIYYTLILMAEGMIVWRLFPVLFVELYLVLYGALWFWIAHWVITLFGVERSVFWRLVIWLVTGFGYIWWMQNASSWIFNRVEGYFLIHPLLPLAESIDFLALSPSVSIDVMTFILLLTNCLWAALFLVPLRYAPLIIGAACAPWMVSRASAPRKEKIPAWVDTIAVLPLSIYEPYNLTKIGTYIQEQLKKLFLKKPNVKVAILPESSLYKCNLESAKEIADAWSAA